MKQITQAAALMLTLILAATAEAAETLALDYSINSVEIEYGSGVKMTLNEIQLDIQLTGRGMQTIHGRITSRSHDVITPVHGSCIPMTDSDTGEKLLSCLLDALAHRISLNIPMNDNFSNLKEMIDIAKSPTMTTLSLVSENVQEGELTLLNIEEL